MIETILLADDGSDHASQAVSMAGDLAARFGSKVVVVHAVQPDQTPGALLALAETEHLVPADRAATPDVGDPSGTLTEFQKGIDKEARRRMAAEALGRQILDRAEAALRGKGVREVSTVMATGDPAHEILAQCKAVEADLVVMGTRGFGTLKGLLVGSVSHKIINLAPCACLLVK